MTANYTTIRDQLTEQEENDSLLINGTNNQFWYDSTVVNGVVHIKLNIGFGYNITDNQGSAEVALQAAGVLSSDRTTADGQFAQILDAVNNPTASKGPATHLNNALGITISESQAIKLMDSYYSQVVVPGLNNDLTNIGVNPSDVPAAVLAGLQDLKYNANSAISASEVPNLNADLQAGNWGAAAFDVGFNPKTDVPARRDGESMVMLGFDVTWNPDNTIASLTPKSVNLPQLIQYEQRFAQGNFDLSDDTNLIAIQNEIVPYLEQHGYYVIQPSDVVNGTTPDAIAASIISNLASHNIVIPGLTVAALEKINADTDASFVVGGLVHLPPLSSVAVHPGVTEVFDPTNKALYTITADLNGSDAGQLNIDTPINDPTYATFAAGTWSGVGMQGADVVVQTALGALTFDPTTDIGTFTFKPGTDPLLAATFGQGLQYNIGNGSAFDLTAVSGTPEQKVLALLGELGITKTADQLATDESAFFNPTPTTTQVLTGNVEKVDDSHANVIFSGPDGSSITGQTTATITDFDSNGNPFQVDVPAHNIVQASGDISHDTISGVPELDFSGNLTLTAAEFAAFSDIKGSGAITVTGGGTVDLTAGNLDASDNIIGLSAADWSGTTLIGNATNGQILTASLFGNDMLVAGSGAGVTLDASDTGGNDTLVAGSTPGVHLNVQDSFGNNTLTAGNGDGITMDARGSTGANILIAGDGNNDVLEIGAFSAPAMPSIDAASGNNTLTAGDGQFDILDAHGTSGNNALTAGSGNGATLNADDSSGNNILTVHDVGGGPPTIAGPLPGMPGFTAAFNNTLSAADSVGNNTLSAGDGNQDLLDVSNSFGDNSLTVGNGQLGYLNASGSLGDNVLSAGTGNGNLLDISDSDGNNSLTTHDIGGDAPTIPIGLSSSRPVAGNNILYAANSGGDNHLTAGDANNDVLDAEGSTGNNVLVAGNGNGDVLTAGDGDDTLTVGNGAADILAAGAGVDILNGGNGGDTFEILGTAPSAGTEFIGGTGSNTLIANGDLTGYTISGIATLQTSYATLTAAQFAEFTTIDANGFAQINVNSGGTFSLAGKTIIGAVSLQTSSSADTTLLAGDAANITLSAQGSTGNVTLVAGNGAADVLIAGAGTDVLTAGSGGDTLVDGTGSDQLNGGAGLDTFYVANPNGGTTVHGEAGDTAFVSGNGTAGGDDFINILNGTVTLASNAHADVLGGSNAITVGNGDEIGIEGGSDDTIAMASGSQLWLNNGGGHVVIAAGSDTFTIGGNGQAGAADIINASSSSFLIEANANVAIQGSNNTGSASGDDTIDITGGNSNVLQITGSGTDVNLNDNGGDIITAANGTVISVAGNGMSGADDILLLSNSTVTLANNAHADVIGGGDAITIGQNDEFGVQGGNYNNITMGSSSYLWINSGNGDTVATTGSHIIIAGGVSNTSISGSHDGVQAANGVTFNLTGSNFSVSGSYDTIYLNASTTNVTITGNYDTVHIRSGDTYTLNGSNDTVVTDTVTNVTNGSTVANFNATTSILDLTTQAYDSSITATPVLNAGQTAGTLVVADHGVTVDTINLTSITSIGTFNVRSDGAGGTLLVDPLDNTTQPGASAPPVSLSRGGDGFVFAELGSSSSASAHDHFVLDQFAHQEAFAQAAGLVTAGGSFFDAQAPGPEAPAEPHIPHMQPIHTPDGFHLV